ncbi:SMP-30/gluconolactonase/LRE family protein [Actinopolymorpha alba]|uniref:SMP-30/gluconolactonase/LRE family protein n=1 Tax=Actinopolymorpha alba TaxID=533267 RepID=UPI00036A3708|nr:SMP-30/gluconolactonase/LRE family protein [Actinopolymorpha alba]
MVDIEQVTDPRAHHGEGPVWHDSWGIRFVDMLAGDILTADLATGEVDRLHIGEVAAAFRPRASGGMVAAIERGFAFVSDDGAVTRLGEVWSDSGVRMNEGGCDPAGRFYCGSMAYAATPGAGSLYQLGIDGSVSVVLPDVTISNGLAWAPDHQVAYYVDTPTGRVDAFDYDPATGLVAESRRKVIDIPSEHGGPDGLTVDADGYLWVALWGGSAVRRYAPDGRLDGVVELPATQVTACTFGGPDLDELYITTSRQGLADDYQPVAGALFRARPGVRGLPVLPYTG